MKEIAGEVEEGDGRCVDMREGISDIASRRGSVSFASYHFPEVASQ